MFCPSRVLLTGGQGFVGKHLQRRLLAAFPKCEIAAPETKLLDVTNPTMTDAVVANYRPDVCIHLAAISAIPAARRDPLHTWQVNLHGAMTLADALRRHVPECLLLFASSGDAYGRSFKAGVPLDERFTLSPMNVYGATKASAEMALLAMAAEGQRVAILRLFNQTGPGQSPNFVVPAFARQIARIEAGLQVPLLRAGALDPQRDFLDVRDACDAYLAVIRHAPELDTGTILNIASGTPRRIGDILAALIAVSGTQVEIETSSSLVRAGEIAAAVGNAQIARSILGWSPSIPWDNTLRDVLDDWRMRVHQEP